MRKWLFVLVGAALTGLILWVVLGGINVWRKTAWPQRPDAGPVKVKFINATGPEQPASPANDRKSDGK